jgi:hypothetical protein
MNISPDQLKILHALRGATALRREPTAAAPDGRHRFFTLTELILEGRLVDSGIPLGRAARGLRQKGLVIGRTLHTHTTYIISDTGAALLAELDEKAAATELVAAELAFEQAEEDWHRATDRLHQARKDITRARTRAERPAAVNLLLDAMNREAAR